MAHSIELIISPMVKEISANTGQWRSALQPSKKSAQTMILPTCNGTQLNITNLSVPAGAKSLTGRTPQISRPIPMDGAPVESDMLLPIQLTQLMLPIQLMQLMLPTQLMLQIPQTLPQTILQQRITLLTIVPFLRTAPHP